MSSASWTPWLTCPHYAEVMSDGAVEQKDRVRSYWEAEPCGSPHAQSEEGTPGYFDEVERRRNELEPFIPEYADFAGSAGSTVLEIGVGLGTDFIRFARAGAIPSGVDLTDHAVQLVRRRLANEGLEGNVQRADAERLPFQDGTFDRVYSWGVLHHTPDVDGAVREALRVVRPGGSACIMLYARNSWVAWGFWTRQALLKGRPWRSRASVLAEHMESAGTKAYTPAELRRMFATLEDVRIDQVLTPYDRAFVGPFARLTGDRMGWFAVVRGRKPAG